MPERSAALVAVIPARIGSTRFPEKPLARIAGVPMIARVVQRVRAPRRLCHVCLCKLHRSLAATGMCVRHVPLHLSAVVARDECGMMLLGISGCLLSVSLRRQAKLARIAGRRCSQRHVDHLAAIPSLPGTIAST